LADRSQDGADNPEIKCQCRRLPDDERGRIGQQRERSGDKEKKWRIEPRVIRRRGAEDLLLAGIMGGHVVGTGRVPLECHRPGRVKAGKIGADRLAVKVGEAVRDHDPADHRNRAHAEQNQAIAARAPGGQPVAGSQLLPDMSHFAAEFYEYCANLASGL
jgi:hypothetical protein